MPSQLDYDIDRLTKAIKHARQTLEYPRAQRARMVRSLAGPEWSEATSGDPSEPLNLVELYLKVVAPNLVSQSPRVLLSTFEPSAKTAVSAMQGWMNRELQRNGFCETLQRAVVDAIVHVGIIKVALGTPADAAGMAWNLKAGQPFIECVDLDDFVFDVHARRFSEVAFIGHRVRRPLEAIKRSKLYSKERLKLQPSRDPFYNQEGDERVNVLGRGYRGSPDDELEDMVDLWEVYLPRHDLILTLCADDGGNPEADSTYEPLREVRWLGPECGPYHILGFQTIPGNILPKGPAQGLFKLHEVVNHLYRKLIRQAERQKEILGVAGTADADGNRIVNAPDGEAIRLDNPDLAKPLAFGAPNAVNLQFADHLAQRFGYYAGNMDGMGGLSPQSGTATQDKLLAASVSRLIGDMQGKTVEFVRGVLKAFGWFQWEHPFNEQSYEHPVPGADQGIPRTLYPRDATDPTGRPRALRRQVPFDKLDLHVDPYSLQPRSPQDKLQSLNQIVTTVVIPMMSVLQQQGVAFDAHEYLTKVGEYLDLPDLADILTIQEPPADVGASGGAEQPGMPQSSQREYVRHNVPMRTERGDSLNMRNALMGVDVGGARKPQGAGA